MIIATPLDIPKLEPDDWATFWDLWNTHSGPLIKSFQKSDFLANSCNTFDSYETGSFSTIF